MLSTFGSDETIDNAVTATIGAMDAFETARVHGRGCGIRPGDQILELGEYQLLDAGRQRRLHAHELR